mgnify:CR=1 FL=1
MAFLRGYKSYIVGFLMVVVAGLRHLNYIDESTFKVVEGLLLGGGIMALRAGISKAGNGK